MGIFREETLGEICQLLRESFEGLLAIYAFGSRIQEGSNWDSDLDLAVLVEGYVESPTLLWKLSGQLANLSACDVDLLDFRRASTVMQYQILMKGKRLWHLDEQAGLYEAAVLSEKLHLDKARSELLADIEQTGKIYG